MRKRNNVPIGQGCKVSKPDLSVKGIVYLGKCKEHPDYYLNVCHNCGEKFHSKRPYALTCSVRCKVAKHRAKNDKMFQTVMRFADGAA